MTFHGPGQCIIYLILNLKALQLQKITHLIPLLENAMVKTCQHFNVQTFPQHQGLFTDDTHKIGFIGMRRDDHISSHGIALNCNVDLSFYKDIVTCGLFGKSVTSLSKITNKNITTKAVFPILLNNIAKSLNIDLVE